MKCLPIIALTMLIACVACVEDPDGLGDEEPRGLASARLALAPAQNIAAGLHHSCLIDTDRRVRCTGENVFGQLGNGGTASTSSPTIVVGLDDAIGVVAGAAHTCALRANRDVVCWGRNSNGQLGDGTSGSHRATPAAVVGLHDVVALTAGYLHTCALQTDRQVRCWGDNRYGALGDGTSTSRTTPVLVTSAALGQAFVVSAGFYHTCALRYPDGSVFCWGDNTFGQLGDGTTTRRHVPTEVPVPARGELATGGWHTCAHGLDNVRCWGRGTEGQLGNNALANSTMPVLVAGSFPGGRSMSAGDRHTCLETNDGISCWGRNQEHQIDASGVNRQVPVAVQLAGDRIERMVAGHYHNLYRNSFGWVYGWGASGAGQLGSTMYDDQLHVFPPHGLGSFRALGVGHYRSLAVMPDGTVRYWGSYASSGLGGGTAPDLRASVPAPVFGLTQATAVDSGFYSSCALRSDRTLRCWGANDAGQLGDGTMTSRVYPVAVSGLSDATEVSVGGNFACARSTDGRVRCWGAGQQGQLGTGSNTSSSTPVVAKVSRARDLAAGVRHACAVTSGGEVRCWGDNGAGQLGDGTLTSSSSPRLVVGLTDAIAVAAGFEHTCALRQSGRVSCWGRNHGGQLGDGTFIDSLQPVAVPGIVDAVDLSAGGQFQSGWHGGYSCVVTSAGAVACWGDGAPLPSAISDGGDVYTVVEVGGNHACGLLVSGRARCWGRNDGPGQLGTGNASWSSVPVDVLMP